VAAANVQSKDTRNQASAATVAATWSNNTITGNLICGAVTYSSGADEVGTIADSQSNSYTKLGSVSDTTNGQTLTFFYAYNITGGTTPTVTVTFNLHGSNSFTYRGIAIHEVSGCLTAAALEDSASQYQATPGTGANGVSSTAKTLSAGDYVFSATMDSGTNASTHTAGTNFTRLTNGSSADVDLASEYLILAAGGSQAGTWTSNTNTNHITCMMAFKAAAVVLYRSFDPRPRLRPRPFAPGGEYRKGF